MNLAVNGPKMNRCAFYSVIVFCMRVSFSMIVGLAVITSAAVASAVTVKAEGETSVYHPADTDENWRMVISEAISYLAGWQQGANPIAYAIRAAYLWQVGEFYSFDSSLEIPLCWTPSGAVEGEAESQIVLNEPEVTTAECGSVFVDPGATAEDADGTPLDVDAVITLEGIPVGEIISGVEAVGSVYLITYSAQPATGGPISVARSVSVEDTQSPVIEPDPIQTFGLFEFGYRDFVVHWEYWPAYYHVHEISCRADWANMDSGTALDACGIDGPLDYWDDVIMTVRLLNNAFQVQEDAYGNDIVLALEEFTEYPGLYRLDYTVTDASGNTAVYEAVEYMRYVEVLDNTRVPFVGGYVLPVADAVAMIEAAGLVPEIIEEHNDIPEGGVISQTPEGGAEAPCGSVVQLLVSLGPCFVPDLYGLTLQEAEAAIEATGYTMGVVDTAPSTAPEGTVIMQSPNVGDPVACGALIHLTLSEGACQLPDVTGETRTNAVAIIETAGFGDIIIITRWDTATSGEVIGQIPGAGIFECNTSVQLVISLGVEPDTMTLYGADPDAIECGLYWTDPGAGIYGGGGLIAGPVYAALIEYQSGGEWMPINPASEALLEANSPYRATYRYEYEQPGTEEPGVFEKVRMIEVFDSLGPQVTVVENPSFYNPESGLPIYLAGCADYSDWSEIETAFGIEVGEVYDQCEGVLMTEPPTVSVGRVYPGLPNPVFPNEPLVSFLENVGLDEHSWMNAPGAYFVAYYVTDSNGIGGSSLRGVIICGLPETEVAGIGLYGEAQMTVDAGLTWEAVRPEVVSYEYLAPAGAYAWDDDELNTPLAIVSEVLTDKNNDVIPFTESLSMENAPYVVTYTSANTTSGVTALTVVREVLVSESR